VPRELTDAEADLIQCDLVRSVNWFQLLCPGLLDADHAIARATHILRLLVVHDGFSYYQGVDRFLWICFIVAHQGAPADWEALAFHLTKAMLDIALTHGFPNSRELEARLAPLDGDVAREAPATAAALAAFRHSAVHYASRWVLLWFADEHELSGILAVWDNIVGVIGQDPGKLGAYLHRLALAHVLEVPVPVDGFPMLQAIQQYREWDVGRILARAGRFKRWWEDWKVIGAVVVIVGGIALYCASRWIRGTKNVD
jgi:hypothetical protein